MKVAGLNTQSCDYPHKLAALVRAVQYRDGWSFELAHMDRGQGSTGLTLAINVSTVNSYPPHEPIRVAHWFPVPPAAYDTRSWQRWLFEQVLLVERHEAMEFFTIDITKPYAPSHGPGNDPYLLREIGTDIDVRTSFRGVLT